MDTENLIIEISDDALEASVLIPAHRTYSLIHILKKITAAGISFGFNKSSIHTASVCADIPRRLVIAQASQAQQAIPARFLKHPDGSNSVESKQCIGHITAAVDTRSGTNVLGQPLNDTLAGTETPKKQRPITKATATESPMLGAGLECTNNAVYTQYAGILFQDHRNVWHICPHPEKLIELTNITLSVSDDLCHASIQLAAYESVAPGILLPQIKEKKILFGFAVGAIKGAALPSIHPRCICVAQGHLPFNGADAVLERFIDNTIDFSTNTDGSIDFKSGSVFKNVTPGMELARKHLPGCSLNGMDILGNTIEGTVGKDIDINSLIQEGACISPSDPNLIIAQNGGIFNMNPKGQIGVLRALIINGDIDMSVGNIQTPYPIIIKGTIKSGFVVKSDSDILVEGLIEDSKVTAMGNIIVNKGILPGKERIKARGNLAALYIRGREVKAQSIIVHKSIRRCTASATQKIYAHTLFGGTTIAAESIEVEILGNELGHRTHIFLGKNPYLTYLINECRIELKKTHTHSDALHEAVDAAAMSTHNTSIELQQTDTGNTPVLKKLQARLRRFMREHTRLRKQRSQTLQTEKVLQQKIKTHEGKRDYAESHSNILVRDTLWHGTDIVIGNSAHRRIDSPLTHITIALNARGDVSVTPTKDVQESHSTETSPAASR